MLFHFVKLVPRACAVVRRAMPRAMPRAVRRYDAGLGERDFLQRCLSVFIFFGSSRVHLQIRIEQDVADHFTDNLPLQNF